MGGYFLEHENFAPANPMVTPEHIAPVWYMTPFYSILRAIPNKLFGVIAMGSSIILLLLLPWLDNSPVRSMRYKGIISRIALGLFVLSFIVLGYLGTIQVTPSRQSLARVFACVYFAYFLLMPFYSRWENHRVVPQRIEK
jgi:ubiquinol-cytochrome c reductase cytochrome b subunit